MSRRALAAAALGVLLALLLAGCASFKKEGDAPASVSGGATYVLVVDAPGDLRKLLQTYLDLARSQGAGDSDTITSVELDRPAAASPAQVRSLLETEGYFNPDVHVRR